MTSKKNFVFKIFYLFSALFLSNNDSLSFAYYLPASQRLNLPQLDYAHDHETISERAAYHRALILPEDQIPFIFDELSIEIKTEPDLHKAWAQAETYYRTWISENGDDRYGLHTHHPRQYHLALITYTLNLDFYKNFNSACHNLTSWNNLREFKYKFFYNTLFYAILNIPSQKPKIDVEKDVLYRGMLGTISDELKTGDPFAFLQFTSTTVNLNFALGDFTVSKNYTGKGTLFIMEGLHRSGRVSNEKLGLCLRENTEGTANLMPLYYHTRYDEDEVLLWPFEKFTVGSIERDMDGLTRVQLMA